VKHVWRQRGREDAPRTEPLLQRERDTAEREYLRNRAGTQGASQYLPSQSEEESIGRESLGWQREEGRRLRETEEETEQREATAGAATPPTGAGEMSPGGAGQLTEEEEQRTCERR